MKTKLLISMIILAVVLAAGAGRAAVVVVADFGASGQQVYTGTYGGSPSSWVEVSGNAGFNASGASFGLGSGLTLTFDTDYGHWNPNDGTDPANDQALLGSMLYAGGGFGVPATVQFSVSGFTAAQYVVFDFVGSAQWGATVNTDSSGDVLVPQGIAGGSFTTVASGLTGSTSYSTVMTEGDHVGEGNLAGMRIVVYDSEGEFQAGVAPEPSSLALILCGATLTLARRRRRGERA